MLDNYYFFQGVLDDAAIGRVLAIADALPKKGGVIGGATQVRDTSYRSSQIAWIPLAPEHHWLYDRLGGLGALANQRMWRFSISGCSEEIQYTEYHADVAGHYDWHMDLGRGPTASRKLSTVTFLTTPDEYEGGDLQFMDGGPPLRPAQGTVAVFPAYLLHRVTPVTAGSRCTLVSWLHGPCFA